ncbi:MAG: glycine cleavage system aminomethyltransferase GcvT [Bdellovibrionales bacterium]|nr:glycine cleavage system aminomethyltransferase GcvT [Bdellovibrionales bacterium]
MAVESTPDLATQREANTSPLSLALRHTPLYQEHRKLGAKFVEFGGWEMPVLYSGVIDEHLCVRSAVGLFDVSHMGEIFVRGPRALDFLERMTTNTVSALVPGKAQYSLLLNEQGGVVDDIIIYLLAPEEYLICVNAANTDKDYEWLKAHQESEVELENASARFGQIAIQGPKARELFSRLLPNAAQPFTEAAFPAFTFRKEHFASGARSEELLIACTGYTGEDGFEVFCPAEFTPILWQALLTAGAELGVKPCGLGARDTLRLEACYPLHGHELTDDLPAISSNVGWVVKFKKATSFIGKDALLARKEQGLQHVLVGFEVVDRGIVREHARVLSENREVGWTSSGTKTPTLDKALGLAFVEPQYAAPGTELAAEVRGRLLKIRVASLPFYRRN